MAPRMHIGDIPTDWVDLDILHTFGRDDEQARCALARLVVKYLDPIRRYIRSEVRDWNDVEDIAQEFTHKLARGDFRKVERTRGRFRDYVKKCLFHMVKDHKIKVAKRPVQMPANCPEPTRDDSPSAEQDQKFREYWRDELLSRAWKALEEIDRKQNSAFAEVLRYQSHHRDLSSDEIASHFSEIYGRQLTGATIRKIKSKARAHFAKSLVAEVKQTLDSPSLQEIEEELCELGFHGYCRGVIREQRGVPELSSSSSD